MAMPMDLVLVRHGESEGNIANWRSRHGDHSAFTKEHLKRHSSKWRLTDKGIEQAKKANEWLRQAFREKFDCCYTSEYLRAMETAAQLEVDKSGWYLEFYLREREYGDLDVMPDDQRHAEYADNLEKRKNDSFFWIPPGGGESMAQLCLRIDRVFNTLHRECEDKRVIIVCHGDVMWAFRVRLERMTQFRFYELDKSDDPMDRLHNCQILHYTRRNPVTAQVAPYVNWMRSVCPWDTSLSSNDWTEIIRPRYGRDDLLAAVEQYPRFIS